MIIMLVSTRTYNVLKNFVGINSSLLLREGTRQLTIDGDDEMLAEVVLDEKVPAECGIYDLSNFIGNLGNLENPSLEFNSKDAIDMVDKDTRVTFYTCKASLLKAPDAGTSLNLKNVDISFKLPKAVLSKALRIAATNSQETIAFARKDNKLSVIVSNAKSAVKAKNEALGNRGVIFICDDEGKDTVISFNRNKIEKLMDADYDVTIDATNYDPGVAVFSTDDGKLRYFLSAVEA